MSIFALKKQIKYSVGISKNRNLNKLISCKAHFSTNANDLNGEKIFDNNKFESEDMRLFLSTPEKNRSKILNSD